MSKKIIVIFLFIIILVSPVSGAEPASAELTEIKFGGESYLIENYAQFKANYEGLDRPVVGLALSGGGARAMVNFGVVKALREEGIAVDFMAGTSMGAIVSTLYGSGLNTDQMLDVVATTSFGRLIDLGIGGSGSLIDTKKLNRFLELVAPQKRLENFEVPAALLSFELTQGKKYLTTKGRISNVIQSSYSIPVYFPIENRGDKYFIDAGILEATPAKSASVLGADFVIATTSFPDRSYKKISSASGSIERFLDVLQENYSQQVIENYADFVIDIDVKDFTFMDFNQVNKLIEIGYETTKKRIPALKRELNKAGIRTVDYQKREKYNLAPVLADLKNNRLIAEGRESSLFLNYGRDQSYFDQELIVPFADNFQTGFEYKNNKLSLALKGDDFFNEGYEARLELKKMSQKTDLLVAYANDYQKQTKDDYRLEVKYFADHFQSSLGYGSQQGEKYYLLGSNFAQKNKLFSFETENDIIYNQQRSEISVLSSNIIKLQLGSKWSLGSDLVYNNTDILASPPIYRGRTLGEQAEFQAALDFKYNHRFIDPLYFGGFFQTTDIGGYLFVDYYKNKELSGETAGIGFNSQLYLLGLRPIALDLYFAYDFEEEADKIALELGYEF